MLAPRGRELHITTRLAAAKIVHHRRIATVVGFARATLAAGATRSLTMRLNDNGKRLLRKRHRIAVTLTVRGTVVGTLVATLRDETFVVGPPGRPSTY